MPGGFGVGSGRIGKTGNQHPADLVSLALRRISITAPLQQQL
jgi:hypothetical protein